MRLVRGSCPGSKASLLVSVELKDITSGTASTICGQVDKPVDIGVDNLWG